MCTLEDDIEIISNNPDMWKICNPKEMKFNGISSPGRM
jgi:hypothetical protein